MFDERLVMDVNHTHQYGNSQPSVKSGFFKSLNRRNAGLPKSCQVLKSVFSKTDFNFFMQVGRLQRILYPKPIFLENEKERNNYTICLLSVFTLLEHLRNTIWYLGRHIILQSRNCLSIHNATMPKYGNFENQPVSRKPLPVEQK